MKDGSKEGSREGSVEINNLVFIDDAARARFEALQTELMTRIPPDGPSGTLQRLYYHGNYVRTRWCSDTVGPSACGRGTASRSRAPGTDWWELNTHTYPSSYPKVLGLTLGRGLVLADAPWGVSLGFVTDSGLEGDRYRSPSLNLCFIDTSQDAHFPVEPPDSDLCFGTRLTWRAYDTILEVAPLEATTNPPLTLLTRLNESPEALSALLVSGYQALEDEVIRALYADEVTREELQMDQYKGDGVPPPALTLHLSPAELEAEKTRARTELARRRAVVTAQAGALHAALRAATPQTLVPR